MKRAIVLAILAVTLTFGPGSAYAFPTGPCAPTAVQSTSSGLSQVQLFLLVLPALARAVA